MPIIGIDPGLTGAVAMLSDGGSACWVEDTPTLKVQRARGWRMAYDIPDMDHLVRDAFKWAPHAIIEEAQAMPGQGVRSTFMIGLGYGLWLALLVAHKIPYTCVRAGQWKHALGLRGGDKESARLRAQQLFPTADLQRKRDHGRAEALLLAYYGLERDHRLEKGT